MKSPDHYGDTVLMDYLVSHKVGFAEGNIAKYVIRWEKKDGIKDLYKARDYLNALIADAELSALKKTPLGLYKEVEEYPNTLDLFDGIK